MDTSVSCARRVPSCSRCRKRKIKCDRQLPNCSQCVAAKSECTGVSTLDGDAHIPRSLVQFLEAQIAQWEIEIELQKDNGLINSYENNLTEDNQTWTFMTPMPASTRSMELTAISTQESLESHVIGSSEFRAMIGATMPTDPALTDFVSRVRMGLTPSTMLSTISGMSPEGRRVPVSAGPEDDFVDASTLHILPDQVIHTLVQKYTRHVFTISPVISQHELDRSLEFVLTKLCELRTKLTTKKVEANFHFLALYLVLAISSTLGCAKTQHESRCLAFSEVLFHEGISHLSAGLSYPTELASLQVTLLILQYAEINPKCANISILNGAAMRFCMELGLHQDPIGNIFLDDKTLDLRRRLFWSAYCIDRTVSPALQRPTCIPDDLINTCLFKVAGDSNEDTPTTAREPALCWVNYFRIISEANEVHFQARLIDQEWSDWLTSMERKLNCWYLENASIDSAVEFAYSQGLVRLHRPSARNSMPTTESLVTAFEAACRSAKHNREPIINGFLRKPWLAAHDTAESAMVAIFCLRYAYDEILSRQNAGNIFNKTKVFTSNLLSLANHGFPEVSNFAATFERLLAPLIAGILTKKPSNALEYPPALHAELQRFLLPGPSSCESYFGDGFCAKFLDLEAGAGFPELNMIDWNEGFFQTLADDNMFDDYQYA